MKLLMASLAFFVSIASAAFADGLPTVPYLYVMGNADVEKPADIVTLRFRLSELSKDAATANNLVQAQAAKVFDLLRATGVADGEIVAETIRSEREYEEPEGNRHGGKFIGYRVERDFVVKVRDLPKFPKLVNDLFALKVGFFDGVIGEYSKAKEVKAETWELALKNARTEADRMAKAAGMKVDSVWALSSEPFPEIRGRMLGDSLRHAPSVAMGSDVRKAEAPPEYRLAPVTFSQSVHVLYLVSQAK